jgi:hypothetical protein
MVDEDHRQVRWRRSTRCGTSKCVEVATDGGSVLIRDSKDPEGPVLTFSAAEWTAFKTGVAAGDFAFE